MIRRTRAQKDTMLQGEVAKLFNIHPRTVMERVKRKELPKPIARNPTVFSRADVERVLHKR